MTRPRLLLQALVLALVLACPVGAQASAWKGQPGGLLTAALNGQLIALDSVSSYHCHDLEAPVVRCFETERERDASTLSANVVALGAGLLVDLNPSELLSLLSVTYVLCYEDSNYGGGSFLASTPLADLGSLGWSNRISSFKSTNGGRPKFWDGTSYSGSARQWATSAWVSYVGASWDNRFSSVQNVP